MLYPVPFLINRYLLYPKIRAQIHDLHLRQDSVIQHGSAKPLRRRRKNHIHLSGQFFHIIIHTGIVHDLKKILIDRCIFLIHITARAVPFDLDLLMACKKSHQFSARISRCSYNSCFDHPLHILSHITSKHHIPVLI